MLRTEDNSIETEMDITAWAEDEFGEEHKRLDVHFEHGQHWVSCLDCGASWSVCDHEDAKGNEGFVFEEVAAGDYSCTEG